MTGQGSGGVAPGGGDISIAGRSVVSKRSKESSYHRNYNRKTPASTVSGASTVSSVVQKKKKGGRKGGNRKRASSDVDTITPGDAADANDPGKRALEELDLEKEKNLIEYSICCGENAIWKPHAIRHALNYS